MKISALLIARNEEKKIKKCLQSLSFADEVIVVLDRTTDQTMSIAKKFYNKIYQGKWEYEGDRRNFGIAKCSNNWILEIDADEIVSLELGREIKTKTSLAEYDFFYIRVFFYYFRYFLIPFFNFNKSL